MKKLLVIMLVLLMATGCSEKAITFADVQEEYEALKEDVAKITENSETFLKADYLNVVSELKELVTNLVKSTEEESTANLQKIYKLTYYIETVSSKFEGTAATKINDTTKVIDALIQANYDGTEEDFNKCKQDALDSISELESLTDNEWYQIEKKVLLKWEDVQEEYVIVEKNAKEELIDTKEVTEAELDDLKSEIIDAYQEIAYGVTVFNQDYAKQIYAAATKLEAYAKQATCKEAKKVKQFAQDSKSYVKQCYGKTLDEDEVLSQDYTESIEAAKKWTQSLWNVITIEFKKAQ